jgi:lytic murein transglycosylase
MVSWRAVVAGCGAGWAATAGSLRRLLVLLFLVLAPAARSQTNDAAFASFLAEIRTEALAAGVSAATFDKALAGVTPDRSLPDLMLRPGPRPLDARGQAEFTKTPAEYLDLPYLGRLAAEGRALMGKHAQTLRAIERELAVDPAILLAVWGRETAFGRFELKHNVVRVLVTQAYLGRRKDMFRKELIAALKLIEQGVLDPARHRSSWAGAVGLTQFMPSEFEDLAYDMDRDGRKDIWNSVPDALASAANQLKSKGWVHGVPWGIEVRTPTRDACLQEGPWNAKPLADWAGDGFAPAGGQTFHPRLSAEKAFLLTPGGAHGPAFLVFENFMVLKRYNFADLYAVFVGHLGDRITGGGAFVTPWTTPAMISNQDIGEIQQRLGARGYPIEKVDGKAGMNTRSLIGKFQKDAGMTVDCWPGLAPLARLRARSGG